MIWLINAKGWSRHWYCFKTITCAVIHGHWNMRNWRWTSSPLQVEYKIFHAPLLLKVWDYDTSPKADYARNLWHQYRLHWWNWISQFWGCANEQWRRSNIIRKVAENSLVISALPSRISLTSVLMASTVYEWAKSAVWCSSVRTVHMSFYRSSCGPAYSLTLVIY